MAVTDKGMLFDDSIAPKWLLTYRKQLPTSPIVYIVVQNNH